MPARCSTSTSGYSAARLVGQLAGAVGRVVVDDQRVELQAVAVGHLADAVEGVAQVVALVVGRQDDVFIGVKYTCSRRAPGVAAPGGAVDGVLRAAVRLARPCGLRRQGTGGANSHPQVENSLTTAQEVAQATARNRCNGRETGYIVMSSRSGTLHLVVRSVLPCVVHSAVTKTAVSSIRATPSRATPSAAGASAWLCGRRYTTYERVEEVPLLVVKRSGAEEVFARAKLLNGLLRACEKRHIPLERIERVADEIEGELRRESVQRVTSADDRRAGPAPPARPRPAWPTSASPRCTASSTTSRSSSSELARLELAGADAAARRGAAAGHRRRGRASTTTIVHRHRTAVDEQGA